MIGWFLESQGQAQRFNKKAIMDHLLQHDGDRSAAEDAYNYFEPYKGEATSPEAQLIEELSKTKPFKRLTDIRFLGALDYCLISHPNGYQSNSRFTRAQHSTGVAVLAQRYLDLTDHTGPERLLCVAAAMLHDVGHPPFSHTLEPIFWHKFQIDHHSMSEAIIYGNDYSNDIPDVLGSFGILPNRVIDVLNGNDDVFDRVFSGPINLDTIEGILRSRNYLHMQNLGLTPLRVLEAATLRDKEQTRQIVDAFWNCKDEMYTLVIRSKFGVFFDYLFQASALQYLDKLERSDFYLTESQAFRKFPALRHATDRRRWQTLAATLLPNEVEYEMRRFFIDGDGDFFKRDDKARYKQTKTLTALTPKDVLPA